MTREALEKGNNPQSNSELRRTTIKAFKTLPRGADNPSLYDDVAAVLIRHKVESFVPHPARALPNSGFARLALEIDAANARHLADGFDPIDDAN